MGKVLRGVIGAIIGGAIGAAIWAAIVHFAHHEYGIIAWGLGGLVGFGMALGAGDEADTKTGVLAALIALAALAVGKFAVVYLVANQMVGTHVRTLQVDDTMAISSIADALIEERTAAGTSVQWPSHISNPNEAREEKDYPADVWQDASARWNALSDEKKGEFRGQVKGMVQGNSSSITMKAAWEVFQQTFSFWDAIWGVFALLTAFRVGSDEAGE